MGKICNLYTKFLASAASDTNKEIITKKFDKTFKNIKFDHEEKKFNQEFLENLFKRKNIN